MTSGTTGVDEFVQAQLGLRRQGLGIALQKAVKGCRRQQSALVSANGLAPVVCAQWFGFPGECFFKPALVAQHLQLFFHLLVAGVAIRQRTQQGLHRLFFHSGSVAAEMLGDQQGGVEHGGRIARQHLAIHTHREGQGVSTIKRRVVTGGTTQPSIIGHAGFKKQGLAKRHTLRCAVGQSRRSRQRFEQGFGLVQQGLIPISRPQGQHGCQQPRAQGGQQQFAKKRARSLHDVFQKRPTMLP